MAVPHISNQAPSCYVLETCPWICIDQMENNIAWICCVLFERPWVKHCVHALSFALFN